MRNLRLGVASTVLVALVVAAPSFGQERSRPIDSPRAAKLHKLAGDILPARARASRRDEARALRSALDALSTSIAETEAQPSAARLALLGSRRRKAESALSELRKRMSRGGVSENADELGRLFAPLWADIDEAVSGAPSRRAGKLAEARSRLEQARSRTTNVHSTSFTSQPLLEGR